MATSSITRNFIITGKEKVEAFANALEESANAYVHPRKVSAKQLTDSHNRCVEKSKKLEGTSPKNKSDII